MIRRSQVEGGIERRGIAGFKVTLSFTYQINFIALPAGHQFTVDGHQHTLGAPIGNPGSTATVHHVVGQPGLVAKVFHPGGVPPKDMRDEAGHLHSIGEHHGSADTNGHHVILATKHTGSTLENTQAWHHADGPGKEGLKAQASALTKARNEHHAEYHGVVHTCVVFIYMSLLVISHS